MAFDIWRLLWYFMLASFGGWIAEVAYNAIVHRKFKNPGMFNGPYCPQYGLMLALPCAVLSALHLQKAVLPTLLICTLTSVLVELIFAWLLLKTEKIRLRDYSSFKWNFKGYICVPLALLRGVCFALIALFVVPVFSSLLHYVNRTIGWIILAAFLTILLLDIVITAVTIRKLTHQFKRLSELAERVREARNALGTAVSESAIGAAERIDDLDLSVRSFNCLKRAGIHSVRQLLDFSENDLLNIRNFGVKSIEEVKDKLDSMGMSLKQ